MVKFEFLKIIYVVVDRTNCVCINLLIYKQSLDKSLSLKQVAASLAIEHRTVFELVSHSGVRVLRGPIIDGCSECMIDSKNVEALLLQLHSQAFAHTNFGVSNRVSARKNDAQYATAVRQQTET